MGIVIFILHLNFIITGVTKVLQAEKIIFLLDALKKIGAASFRCSPFLIFLKLDAVQGNEPIADCACYMLCEAFAIHFIKEFIGILDIYCVVGVLCVLHFG